MPSSFLAVLGLFGVVFLSGCSALPSFTGSLKPQEVAYRTDDNGFRTTPLQKATLYWAKRYRANPRDVTAAISYAVNLKAMGADVAARTVLAEAYASHPDNPKIASEYGRLVLAQGDLPLAEKLLTQAQAGMTQPDWRLLSALGTLKAKQGDLTSAEVYYQKALAAAPGQASVLNNLALVYALKGDTQKAENLLRQARHGRNAAKVRRNLALIQSLKSQPETGNGVGAEAGSQPSVALRRQLELPPATQPATPPPETSQAETDGPITLTAPLPIPPM